MSNSQQPPDRNNILQTAQGQGENLSDQGHTSQVRDIVGASETVHNPGHGDHTVEKIIRLRTLCRTLCNPMCNREHPQLKNSWRECFLPLLRWKDLNYLCLMAILLTNVRFKACVKVEIERKGVYDNVKKLNFLLDAVTGSTMILLIPGSERYAN